MQQIDLMLVTTALSLARLHLSLFLETSKNNDKRTKPQAKLFQVIPYPDGRKRSLADFQEDCKDQLNLIPEYTVILKKYRSTISDKRVRFGIDMAVQFYERQIVGIEHCLQQSEPHYQVIFDYYPDLTKDLDKSVKALEAEAKRIMNTALGSRFADINFTNVPYFSLWYELPPIFLSRLLIPVVQEANFPHTPCIFLPRLCEFF